MAQLRQVPGLIDLRVQQPLDYPTLEVAVDRVKAAQAGYTEQNVAASVLNALSGSFQITPMFFVNWKNGVDYNLVAHGCSNSSIPVPIDERSFEYPAERKRWDKYGNIRRCGYGKARP
jgi:hypothetical protein